MEKPPIVYEDFARVDIRIGRIVTVRPFERARNPSYKIEVDFGPMGRKWSSAQITSYSQAELIGRLVACVVNMPPRNIAGFQSEVLILGAKNARGGRHPALAVWLRLRSESRFSDIRLIGAAAGRPGGRTVDGCAIGRADQMKRIATFSRSAL